MEDHSKWERTDGTLVLFGRAQMEDFICIIYPKNKCGQQLVEVQFAGGEVWQISEILQED